MSLSSYLTVRPRCSALLGQSELAESHSKVSSHHQLLNQGLNDVSVRTAFLQGSVLETPVVSGCQGACLRLSWQFHGADSRWTCLPLQSCAFLLLTPRTEPLSQHNGIQPSLDMLIGLIAPWDRATERERAILSICATFELNLCVYTGTRILIA